MRTPQSGAGRRADGDRGAKGQCGSSSLRRWPFLPSFASSSFLLPLSPHLSVIFLLVLGALVGGHGGQRAGVWQSGGQWQRAVVVSDGRAGPVWPIVSLCFSAPLLPPSSVCCQTVRLGVLPCRHRSGRRRGSEKSSGSSAFFFFFFCPLHSPRPSSVRRIRHHAVCLAPVERVGWSSDGCGGCATQRQQREATRHCTAPHATSVDEPAPTDCPVARIEGQRDPPRRRRALDRCVAIGRKTEVVESSGRGVGC